MLKDLKISPAGMDISRTAHGKGANRVSLTAMLNSKINEVAGIGPGQRSSMSSTQIDEVFAKLDAIADEIIASLKLALEK
jgi:hypothetical protein